ncbi:conserved protein of unknown function [Ruminococcaceae bacterium BL-6]|nr:conserved protein of unknown function [Ruminococcaceae bacterium BL-6]
MADQKIRLGIGFATGRKNFRKVLNTYIYSWKESRIPGTENVSLSLFVAYDVDYSNTQSTDYTNLTQEVVDVLDEIYFIGKKRILKKSQELIRQGVLTEAEAKLVFGTGYAAKRNAVLYAALESHMDYLLFLDDDEYPLAVTNNRGSALWSGQYVLPYHLASIGNADITYGYHCGYISPVPYIQFDEQFSERDFRRLIGAISNDVINWNSIRTIMENDGVTYADTSVLIHKTPEEVPEINGCKFISGSNLCINLTRPERTFPFYNPPGARGEDTFLSTLLGERTVLRVPCYTFHDGFSAYHHLLDGVLPIRLNAIGINSGKIVSRFYRACVGWVRYKPLLLYITDRDGYDASIRHMTAALDDVLPKVCDHFQRKEFQKLSAELAHYDKNVKKHYAQFLRVQKVWKALLSRLETL